MNDKRRAIYTHGYHESVLRSHRRRTAENSAGYLLPYLVPGLSVLDVGCGPGTITVDLAARVVPGSVTGVEPTDDALSLARAEAQLHRLSNISFTTSDVHKLDFPDDAFDVVHAHQVLQHVADPVRALQEMRRVCTPGGIVAARDADYSGFIWFPKLPALDRWLDLYERAARANGGEPDAGRRLLSWARAAGFDDVTPTASVWCFATASAREWWGLVWADRILQSDLAHQLVDSGLATAAQLEEISTRGESGPRPRTVGWRYPTVKSFAGHKLRHTREARAVGCRRRAGRGPARSNIVQPKEFTHHPVESRRLFDERHVGTGLEEFQSRARNPALHFSHVLRRTFVETAHHQQGRHRDVGQPVDDVPVSNIPNDAKVAGPKHRLEDLGSHVGECFREFPGPGAGAAQISLVPGSDRGLVFGGMGGAGRLVTVNCRASCHVQARLQADQTGRKFGYRSRAVRDGQTDGVRRLVEHVLLCQHPTPRMAEDVKAGKGKGFRHGCHLGH